MYKVDADKFKLQFNKLKDECASKFFMYLFGFILAVGAFTQESFSGTSVLILMAFIYFFVHSIFVLPLIGKLTLVEEELEQVKQKLNVDSVKHY
jgi:hypothetical protein